MSTPRRYELSDFEWSIIQPLLPNKPRGAPRADDQGAQRHLLAPSQWLSLGRHPGALWTSDDLRRPSGGEGAAIRSVLTDARPLAAGQRPRRPRRREAACRSLRAAGVGP